MSATVTIRRTARAVLVEVDAGEDGELPPGWLSRWRVTVVQAGAPGGDPGLRWLG